MTRFGMASFRSLGNFSFVMAGHSRSKNGVASLAYDPAIHVLLLDQRKTWMPATSAGMTNAGGRVRRM